MALTPVWDLGKAAAYFLIAEDAPGFDEELDSSYDPDAEKAAEQAEEVIPYDSLTFPAIGERYGNVSCERINLNAPVYWGDTNKILRSGAGNDIASYPPGFGRIVILSAHNTTFFRPLKVIEVGDVVKFDTNYESYEYEITSVEVYHETKLQAYFDQHLLDDEETLLMYTCYPFHAISGRKTNRLVAMGKRISGKSVKWRET